MLCVVQTCSEAPVAAGWAAVKLPGAFLISSLQRKDNPDPEGTYG